MASPSATWSWPVGSIRWWTLLSAPELSGAEPVRVERAVPNGAMLARDGSGAVVLVRGGLPGEQVLVDTEGARIRPVRSVLVPSPARRVPPCQDAGRCGGCAWMHATSAAQATLAQEVVQDAFARLAGIDCSTVLDGPLRSVAASGYRMVARLAATRSGTLGYRPWHESVPVEVTRCVVLREDLEAVRRAVRVVGDGEVVLRGDDEGMVVVLPRPGVEVRRAPKDASVVPAGVEAPQLRLRFSIAGRWWSSRPTSFAQPSSAGAALLAEAVSDFAGRPRRLLDAYAGIGVLGGVVAERTGAALVAVEANRGAALDAEENLADLGAVVLAGRMERHVGALVDAHVDVVVADPPRSGLRAEGSAALASLEAPAIVLVGCEPAAHARDVALLVRAGYRPSAMRLLGLFPETHHVEVVTRLERRSPGSGSPRR